MKSHSAEQVLRKHNLRVTKGRVNVLSYLKKQSKPVSIKKIHQDIDSLDRVSLYRMMDSFEKNGIVSSHDIGHGHLDYELTHDNHHHHLVCESCGVIEDVTICDFETTKQSILSSVKNFQSITQHKVTLLGQCKACK